MKKLLFTLTIVLLGTSLVWAQAPKKKYRRFSVGVNLGATQFLGDIQRNKTGQRQVGDWSVNDWKFGFGGNVAYQLGYAFGVNFTLLSANLSGQKSYGDIALNGNSQNNYASFKANVVDYSLNFTCNFLNLLYRDKTKPRRINPYVSLGYGFTSFRSMKKRLDTEQVLDVWGYDKKTFEKIERTTEVIVPVAFGVKFRLSKSFDLGIEQSLRNAFTEKLDATAGSSKKEDKYGYLSLSLTYKIGKSEESEEWVNPFEALNKNLDDIQSNIDGLAKDADGDGVSDLFDKEPNTPAGVAVDGSGRSLDVDTDGVPDHMDTDPFSAKGAKVDENGKEIDSDNDGVADGSDIEPNTKPGALVNFQGKTIELTASNNSSNVTNNSSTTVMNGVILPSVYFKVNSSNINYWSSYEALATVAKLLKANPSLKLNVIGNCDRTATEQFNDDLAKRRADEVIKHIVDTYKIDGSRLKAISKGEIENLVPTADGVDKNINRRVDFEVAK